ncbi:hypothetical protein LAZ67_9000508 [Cordylochernes scorpioides]|uniref:Transposase n=1 Tax=Cordylochernes scorpioides TaxID=51811 RepID=A0ABY6KW68_9ARAC|nr:hypothetical protein LAZ67_9000508 [Cordylochernes scorpioides]
MSSLYQIEKLNSENYETWKMQMKMILIHSELWDYANSIRIKPETEVESNEWEKNDQKALATIVLSLSPPEIIHVKRCKTSAEAWKLLNEVHQPKGPATKVFLTKQLILLKMNPNERLQDYLNNQDSKVKLGEDGCTPAAGDGHVSGEQVPKNDIRVGGGMRSESGHICGEWKTRRVASRSVDDPARRYQDHGIGAAYKDIDVGVSVHPEALFKEVGRHDIPFSADDAKEDHGSRESRTLALMNEAYEDEIFSRTQVYFWYKRFKDDRKSIADDSRSDRPLTSTTDRNIKQVRDLIVADRKNTIDNISEILGISYGSFQNIIGNNLNMIKLCDSDFSKRIITGDETCCFLFDPQTKKPSLEWHTPSSPRRNKVCLDKSKGKVMLVVFFDYQRFVYYEYIKEGVTINKQVFKEILWKLLQDNAPAHREIIVQDYLAKHSVSVLPHPPYSPDIVPCDLFSFPKLKMTLKGRRFSSSSEVIENATVELNKLRKIDFELAFQQLFSRCKNCVDK